jgi:epsilon-lactone hydrolase
MGVGGRRLMLELLTAAARPPKGTRYQRVTVADVPVERVQTLHASTHGTLIYLHGGAYALGSAKGYRGLVAHLAAAARMTALIPDYSRAPEAQYPVALEEWSRSTPGCSRTGSTRKLPSLPVIRPAAA